MIEVCNRGRRFRQGRMRWRSVIYRRKVGLVLTGQMFLLHLCVHRSIALLARRGKLGLVWPHIDAALSAVVAHAVHR